MKDNWFEFLLSLFEKTLAQLRTEPQTSSSLVSENQAEETSSEVFEPLVVTKNNTQIEILKPLSKEAIRVVSIDERVKLTKASQQFLFRLQQIGILSPDLFEVILNQLTFSESRYVGLQETKWAVRKVLMSSLNADQTAFLDLILYQKEDGLAVH